MKSFLAELEPWKAPGGYMVTILTYARPWSGLTTKPGVFASLAASLPPLKHRLRLSRMALEAGIWLAKHALMAARIGDMIGCLARRSVQDECRKTTSRVVQVNSSISGVVEAPGMRVVIETGSFAVTLHDMAVGPE